MERFDQRDEESGVVKETRRVDSFEATSSRARWAVSTFPCARCSMRGQQSRCTRVRTSRTCVPPKKQNCPLTSSANKLFDSREFDVPAERNIANRVYFHFFSPFFLFSSFPDF